MHKDEKPQVIAIYAGLALIAIGPTTHPNALAHKAFSLAEEMVAEAERRGLFDEDEGPGVESPSESEEDEEPSPPTPRQPETPKAEQKKGGR